MTTVIYDAFIMISFICSTQKRPEK